MSQELELVKDLFAALKNELHKDLEMINRQIESLTRKVDDFQKNASDINIKIGIIQEKQQNLKNDLEKNFSQHDDFYKRLNDLEKIPHEAKKAKQNENEIIKIKTTARTAYIIFGIIITILGLLFKLRIL
jgi:uncharacterized coiled-coil DUF342 family protein